MLSVLVTSDDGGAGCEQDQDDGRKLLVVRRDRYCKWQSDTKSPPPCHAFSHLINHPLLPQSTPMARRP